MPLLMSEPRVADDSGVRDGVLITDSAQRAALVSIRELGRSGVRVCAVDSDPYAPGRYSRWADSAEVVTGVADGACTYVDELLGVCAEYRPRALITCHDGTIDALRQRRDEVEQVVALALAREEGLAVALDKRRTLEVAEQLGIRIPRGAVVETRDQVDKALLKIEVPAVIKPARSWSQGDSAGRRLVPTVAVERADARHKIDRLLETGASVIVQEWLPGAREAVSLFRAHGRVWARFAQVARRTTPPLGGNSVVRESIPLPADIAGDAEALVDRLDLDGYAEVEFRRDADGRPALMEINPRLSASVEVAVQSGVSFPRLLYRWAAGGELEPVDDYRVGVRARWLGGDLSWLRHCLAWPDDPDAPSRPKAIAQFAAGFLRPATYDYLTRGDLRPAAAAAVGKLRGARRAPHVARPTDGDTDAEVAVIGAGPYGLSIAAHLAHLGVSHEVFGEPMSTWRHHMPDGMYLKSEGFASNLSDPRGGHTLARYCAEHGIEYGDVGIPIRLDTFSSYGLWFQERLVPAVRRNLVSRVQSDAGGFTVTLDTGESLRTRDVIVASGLGPFAFTPPELAGLPDGAVSHTFDNVPLYDPSRELAIVGAGQSGIEAATLAHEHGVQTHLIVRADALEWNSRPDGSERRLRAQLKYPRSGLGEGRSQYLYATFPLGFHEAPLSMRRRHAYTALGPAGSWWLRSRFDFGTALLCRSVRSAAIDGDRVRLRLDSPLGEEDLLIDHVIAATGYRPGMSRLRFLDADLLGRIDETDGTPILDRTFQSSVPGLYFVGFPAGLSFGPVMRFVYGTAFAARQVGRALRAR